MNFLEMEMGEIAAISKVTKKGSKSYDSLVVENLVHSGE